MSKKAVTICEIGDQDWKTQRAWGYDNVPSGAEVEIIEENYVNFYGGPWTRIRYAGNLYWVCPDDLRILS